MSDPARIIKAVFADWRTVKGRKQLQLIFEVPLEEQNIVLEMLGAPMPDRHIPVAIALLDPDGLSATPDAQPDLAKTEMPAAIDRAYDKMYAKGLCINGPYGSEEGMRKPAKAKRAFCDLPFPQQSGIKSEDLTFQLWLSTYWPHFKGDCAEAIRAYCGVESRADILPGTVAGDRWIELLRAYEQEHR